MHRLILFLVFTLLVGCNQQQALQKLSTPEDQAFARTYIDKLRARDFAAIDAASDPTLKGPGMRATLERMASLIPAGEPGSVTLVGTQSISVSKVTQVSTTFEYDFGGKWFLINVVSQSAAGQKTIVGLNVLPEAKSLEEQNRFTLAGKDPVQHMILIAAVLSALLILFALVVCIRTKLKGRKWPWVVFILFGVGKLSVSWGTGQWSVVPLAIQVLGASVFRPLYGAWVIAASLPLGALVFLILRRKLRLA